MGLSMLQVISHISNRYLIAAKSNCKKARLFAVLATLALISFSDVVRANTYVLLVRRQRLWNRFSSGLRECFCSS